MPNRLGWGTKDFSQLPGTPLSSLPRRVSNLPLLLVAGDKSSCPALGILLQDLIRSPVRGQQVSFPRFPVPSLGEVISHPSYLKRTARGVWFNPEKGPVVRRQRKSDQSERQQQSWSTMSDGNLRFYSQFTETLPPLPNFLMAE